MKRERYFQDELRKMFVSYAVIPVFVFTLVCGVIFMAAFLYGRLSFLPADSFFQCSIYCRDRCHK